MDAGPFVEGRTVYRSGKSLMTIESRFWSKVDKRGLNECWLWTGAVCGGANGYGCIKIAGRAVRANRVAWEMAYGPVPEGLLVCHSCDTPLCVNVQHLWIGTNAENMEDRNRKKRNAAGQRHGRTHLTSEDIHAIRAAVGSQKAIAIKFGIAPSSVSAIRSRKFWSHVPENTSTDAVNTKERES